MDEELIDEIEGNVEDLPDEVKDFVFGEEFEAVTQELSALLIDENQKKDLPSEIMLFIFGTRTVEELASYVDTLATSEENKQKIKEIIDDKIISELLLSIEANKEIDEEATKDVPAGTAKIATPLSSLADRLKEASIATSARRDYGTSGEVPAAPTDTPLPEAPKRTIDPYHEAIDNE